MKRLRQAVGQAFASGVVLYDGDSVLSFGDRLFAVPMSALCVESKYPPAFPGDIYSVFIADELSSFYGLK